MYLILRWPNPVQYFIQHNNEKLYVIDAVLGEVTAWCSCGKNISCTKYDQT